MRTLLRSLLLTLVTFVGVRAHGADLRQQAALVAGCSTQTWKVRADLYALSRTEHPLALFETLARHPEWSVQDFQAKLEHERSIVLFSLSLPHQEHHEDGEGTENSLSQNAVWSLTYFFALPGVSAACEAPASPAPVDESRAKWCWDNGASAPSRCPS